jgi:hypothetical protein
MPGTMAISRKYKKADNMDIPFEVGMAMTRWFYYKYGTIFSNGTVRSLSDLRSKLEWCIEHVIKEALAPKGPSGKRKRISEKELDAAKAIAVPTGIDAFIRDNKEIVAELELIGGK